MSEKGWGAATCVQAAPGFKSQYYYLGTRARVGSMFPHQQTRDGESVLCDYFTSKQKHNKGNKTDGVLSESTVHICLCTVRLFWQ